MLDPKKYFVQNILLKGIHHIEDNLQKSMYSKDNPLLMIPGPVESHQSTLDQLSKRVYAHTEEFFINSFYDAILRLREVFQVDETYSPVIIGGAGTLAMELAMINLIDTSKQEKVLICDTGYFGARFTKIAEAFGISYDVISTKVGTKLSVEELSTKLETGEYTAAFIQHVDTSTGVCNNIKEFGAACNNTNTLSIVDGVCSAGGIAIYQKHLGIDVYFTGAQKALAVPPSLAILMFSPKAKEKNLLRKAKIPSYYSDLENWWAIFDAYGQKQIKYFSTPATNSIVALNIALKNILDEGLETRFNRHKSLSKYFRDEMSVLGFKFLTASDSFADTLSTPIYRKGEDKTLLAKIKDLGILLAGGIQSGVADTYFRVGHMGEISKQQIDFLLDTIRSLS